MLTSAPNSHETGSMFLRNKWLRSDFFFFILGESRRNGRKIKIKKRKKAVQSRGETTKNEPECCVLTWALTLTG